MNRSILPRLIRLRDAPAYLGMDRNRFNAEARPYVIEIPIGEQGIAFDRLDLDAWADQYKSRTDVRRILNLAASEWIDEYELTWLVSAPKIRLLPDTDKRQPYPLSWDE
jgi:hypothetical protein